MNIDDGGGLSEETAPFTFGTAEPTVHEFVPGQPEQATRITYTADASGVGYSLVVSTEALKSPNLIATVAGQVAAAMNADAAISGVADIAEAQDTQPLGSLKDIFQVAIESKTGKSSTIVDVDPLDMRPDLLAETVAEWQANLAALEGAT